jgi:hypothetical protein
MQSFQQAAGHGAARALVPFFGGDLAAPWKTERPYTFKVLRTDEDKKSIAELRKLAAFGVEQDLCLNLAPLEQVRDEIGVVAAVYEGARLVLTLRFVPTGHGLTGAERLFAREPFDPDIIGAGSWELGRVIVAPEDRHPDLLLPCLTAALHAFQNIRQVDRFHATTTLAMARLWRRFGMRTVLTTAGESGTRYALVHGLVEDIAVVMGATTAPHTADA